MTRAPGTFTLPALMLLAACQAGASTVPGAATSDSEGTGRPVDPAMTAGSGSSPTPDVAAPAVIDVTLLDYLPEAVEGTPVTEAIDEAALALADPTLPRIATALDVGLAIDQASGNLTTAHVVRLREGAFDDATFRQWRDSYDEGACAAAGGVDARAEAPIGGRNVFVTSCVDALRTYHVWLEDQHLLISASSVGERRFGELLLSQLRIP